MEIGERLKKARAMSKMTQAQVALAVHVTRTTISNWENSRSYPDISSLLALSNLYQLSLDTLIKEDYRMMDDLKQKEQARRRAAWTQYTALAVDAGIVALFAGQALGVAGMTMGTTTQYGLIVLLWINLIVIGLNAPQFQALVKPLRRNNQKRQVRIGLVLIAVAVVAALDPRHTLNPWLLGLLICGAVILLWRTSKNRSDR